jgi:hypothetical protein
MKTGELFKHKFDVEPCNGGGFLVYVHHNELTCSVFAFTNLADLLRWQQSHAGQQQQADQQSLKDRLLAKQEERKANGGDKPIPLPGGGEQRRTPWFKGR